MRRLLVSLVMCLAAATASRAASPLYVCPDVPTQEGASSTTLLPWSVARYDGSVPAYSSVLTVPGNPSVDGIHKLDQPGDWLFSVEVPSDLGGALTTFAEGRDVIRYQGASGTYALFFCGGSVAGAVPDGVNVDAILVDGGDSGDLWVSFDVPADIGALTFEPSDLVAYRRTAAGCSGWSIAPANPAFDASAAGTGIPPSSNVIGAAKVGAAILLTLDVPTSLGPPGLTDYTTDQVLSWAGGAWSVWEPLSGWPASSVADGLSWVGNPGRVEVLTMAKSGAIPGNLDLSWTAGCSDGGMDYGIYEGSLGAWYSHAALDCSDAGSDRTESITPAAGNHYYLVVPLNPVAEGSYGVRTGPIERPVGLGVCAGMQLITACP